jgi:hypothetical protein
MYSCRQKTNFEKDSRRYQEGCFPSPSSPGLGCTPVGKEANVSRRMLSSDDGKMLRFLLLLLQVSDVLLLPKKQIIKEGCFLKIMVSQVDFSSKTAPLVVSLIPAAIPPEASSSETALSSPQPSSTSQITLYKTKAQCRQN